MYSADAVHADEIRIQSLSIAAVCFQSTLFQAGRPVSKWVDRFQSRSVVVIVTHVIRTSESSEEMHGNSPHISSLFSLNALGIFHISKTY